MARRAPLPSMSSCPNHETADEAPVATQEGLCADCYIEAESYLHPVQADYGYLDEDAG